MSQPPGPGADKARRAAIEQAALWYARMLPGAGDLGDAAAVRSGFERWLAAAPQHAEAWNTVQAMGMRLNAVPAPLATPVLGRAAPATRRTALRGLAVVGLGATAAWMGWRHLPWPQWRAEYATGTGERRRLMLADGGELQLDTQTRLDIDYGPRLRRLRLHAGAILVQTHADADAGADGQRTARPFVVDTPQGRIEALGTRFEVRTHGSRGGYSQVSVMEHAVRITAARQAAAQLVRAGEQSRFTADGVEAPQAVSVGAGAWVRGQLVLTDVRLDQVLAELGRYRRGWLDCDPAIAGLRISGVLPVTDTDQALATLADGFALRVEQHWGGWRTHVAAR